MFARRYYELFIHIKKTTNMNSQSRKQTEEKKNIY